MTTAPGTSRARRERILVISPVRNEVRHIAAVARAVGAQTRPPDTWLVVDDGSTDGTAELLRSLDQEIECMTVVTLGARSDDVRDRLAVAAEARAFNHALATVDASAFTHVGKLDGDIELPADYYERILEAFRVDPGLGLAGGTLVEPCGDGWKCYGVPDDHVHGAVKLYTRECFEAIGGIQERLGWDTIDEVYAQLRGFSVRSLPAVVARHHRPHASADGKLRGRARHGECAYILQQSVPWTLARSLRVATVPPYGLSALAFLWGFGRAAVCRRSRVDDPEFRRHVRKGGRARVARALLPRLSHAEER